MKLVFFALLIAGNAFATSSTRTVSADNVQNTTGGSSLAVPATGSALTSDTNTQTLQNKTISGAQNTISNIAASSISSGQIGVANGGTGASTLASGAIVLGNGTSAVNTLSGTVTGQVATWNGSAWTAATPSSFAPVINNSQASPQSVTAAGGISLTGLAYVNVVFVAGSGGAVTVTATPSVTNCTAAGQLLYIVGEDGTNTVTLQDNSALAGSNLLLNGNVTLGLNSSISLICDGNSKWVEFARQ